MSALINAIKKNDPKLVEKLLEDNQIKDYAADNNNEALHLVIKAGRSGKDFCNDLPWIGVYNKLLTIRSVRENAHALNNEAIQLAFLNRNLENFVYLFLLRIVATDPSIYCLLPLAVSEENLEGIIQSFLVSFIFDKESSSLKMTSKQDLEYIRSEFNTLESNILKFLHDLNSESSSLNKGPFYYFIFVWAAHNGYLNIVNKLLTITYVLANSHNYNNWALCGAAINGHVEIVKELIKIQIIRDHADDRNNFALNEAIKAGQLLVVKELLTIRRVRELSNLDQNQPFFLESSEVDGKKAFKLVQGTNENSEAIASKLFNAIIKRNQAEAVSIIDNHKDQSFFEQNGMYFLKIAISYDCWSVVSRLIKFKTVSDEVTKTYNILLNAIAKAEKFELSILIELIETYESHMVPLPQYLKFKHFGTEHTFATLKAESSKAAFQCLGEMFGWPRSLTRLVLQYTDLKEKDITTALKNIESDIESERKSKEKQKSKDDALVIFSINAPKNAPITPTVPTATVDASNRELVSKQFRQNIDQRRYFLTIGGVTDISNPTRFRTELSEVYGFYLGMIKGEEEAKLRASHYRNATLEQRNGMEATLEAELRIFQKLTR